MNRKTFLCLLTTTLLLVSIVVSNMMSLGYAQIWVPAAPHSRLTSLEFWMDNQTGFMTVTIMFPCLGWKIEDWGTLSVNGSDFSADAEIWYWTGPSGQMIWYAVHDYNLGQLAEGVYSFTFKSFGYIVRSMFFEVGFPADINDDGRVEMRDIGTAARAFGTNNPHPDWNPDADIYRDGTVDMIDIGFTAKHYGEMVP